MGFKEWEHRRLNEKRHCFMIINETSEAAKPVSICSTGRMI